MFFFDFGDLNEKPFQLIGASPEVHVRMENDRAILRPIAGTRPRGSTEQKDIALAKVDSPVNVNVILNQKQAEGLTYGGELIGSFQDVNWGEINKRKKNWISQWNEIFAN